MRVRYEVSPGDTSAILSILLAVLGEARGLVVTVSLLVPPVQLLVRVGLVHVLHGRCSLSIAHRESLDPDLKQDLKIRPAGVPSIFSALLVEFGEASGLMLTSFTPLVVKSWFGPLKWRLPELRPAELRPVKLRPFELRPEVKLRPLECSPPDGLSLPSRTVLGLDSL